MVHARGKSMHQLSDCTHHARVRMQQRGIAPSALELLMDYGRASHDHHGRVLVHMDANSRRSVLRDYGAGVSKVLDRVRGLYAVMGKDGVVITVGHRYRRMRRE